jgi:TonB family protein
MYFNFDENRPDTPVMPRTLSRLEVTLLTIVFYLSIVVLYLVSPHLPFVKALEARRQQAIEAQRQAELKRQRDNARFVYVAPRIDTPAPKPPPRAELSDIDREARTVERAPKPTNSMPFSRGRSPERIEGSNGDRSRPEDTPPAPEVKPAPAGGDQTRQGIPLPDAVVAQEPRATENGRNGQLRGPAAGVIADAIRNVQKYAQKEGFGNLQGGANQDFSQSIQFDTKGVEFGPWLRRFVAQIRRNWFIPEAAMTLKGKVVITFFVHKDGRITDLQIIRPSSIDGFNNSSFNALAASNPTQPLPPEYPDEKAFFTVSFFYNETPQLP